MLVDLSGAVTFLRFGQLIFSYYTLFFPIVFSTGFVGFLKRYVCFSAKVVVHVSGNSVRLLSCKAVLSMC